MMQQLVIGHARFDDCKINENKVNNRSNSINSEVDSPTHNSESIPVFLKQTNST